MNSKVLVIAGMLLAFVIGAMANGFYSNTTKAVAPPEEIVAAPAKAIRTTPVAARSSYVAPAPRYVAAADSAPRTVEAKRNRSWQKEALIIGGSAGAGAAIGAVAGGKKGAAIGAISGGVAGLVYDLATRNKK
jgi:hypothetical protein